MSLLLSPLAAEAPVRKLPRASNRSEFRPSSERESPHECTYLPAPELSNRREKFAFETEQTFRAFSKQVFADGALNGKTKQLIAVAVAHVTQCPYCIRKHTKAALRAGALPEELMETIWVAAEMRAGAASAHATIALAAMEEAELSPSATEHK